MDDGSLVASDLIASPIPWFSSSRRSRASSSITVAALRARNDKTWEFNA